MFVVTTVAENRSNVHRLVRRSRTSAIEPLTLPTIADTDELGAPMEIAAVVLFGSVALWLAESLTAR